ncbi:hypothetical protein AKUH4B410M_04860 [Apilactobacillus kunkeei]|nr:hypothetical protein AKUH4B405J_04860 [Apilactobacillus kunkeei]CAI2581048.1 hypothetical protein AKUH4B102A_04880 [Apilactobacillus kunkeei]CAI2582008.1 hypothetical protein AKUH4B410M_04860 [Apilactobacillus kunkeei]CAI2652941.1 hypothetical protein AKUH3B102X_04850 [Apilactobacillus kunkeei]
MFRIILLIVIAAWGLPAYTIQEFLKSKCNETNTFDRRSTELTVGSVMLLFLKDLMYYFFSSSFISLLFMIILDLSFIALMFIVFTYTMKVDTKGIFGFVNSKKILYISVGVFAVVLMFTGVTYAMANDGLFKGVLTANSKTKEHLSSFKVKIDSVAETPSHKYLKMTGNTKAPNGSKIYVYKVDDTDLISNTSAFSDTSDSDWSIVKNGRFTAYVNISDISDDSDYKVGSKLSFLTFAMSGTKHKVDHYFYDNQLTKLYKNSTKYNYTVSKAIHDALYVSDSSDDSSDSSSDVSDADSSTYTDDMKDDINDSLSSVLDVKSVSVSGQFDIKPMSMSITVKSDDFSGYPDKDYYFIIKVIKACQKYNPGDFDNIKIILSGKLTGGAYVPIQAYEIPGKTIKGLNTDGLDSTDLETISTDYYYRPNNN